MPLKQKRTDAEYRAIGKMVEDLYLQHATSTGRLLWYNFVRGLAYGFGIFLAGTVLVAFLLWFLGLFDDSQVPFVSRFVRVLMDSLQK